MYVSCALVALIGASVATTEFSINQTKMSLENGCNYLAVNVQPVPDSCPLVSKLDTMDTRLGAMDNRLGAMDTRLGAVERLLQQTKTNVSCTTGDQTQQLKQIAAQLKAVNDLLEQHLLQPAEKTDDGPVNVTFPNGSYTRDCSEIFTLGSHSNGVYLIQPKNSPEPIPVFCEMSHAGWTVIMNRIDGSVDFYRRWSEYKQGFGSPDGEYYLGNEKIFWLTNQKRYRLRVDLTFWGNTTQYYADYHRFILGNEASEYSIQIAEYKGNAFDRMGPLSGRRFTTWDNDNDSSSSSNCARTYKAPWWYTNCCSGQVALLFGRYGNVDGNHLSWLCASSNGLLKKAVLKIMPILS